MALSSQFKDRIVVALKESLKFDDKEFVNPWKADKQVIVHEWKCFADSPINTHQCLDVGTKILYYLSLGGSFLPAEVTDVFFKCMRLFGDQKNPRLRRMAYLLIKSLPVGETEVFMATASLAKDMHSNIDCYRANSIRVLSRIIDGTMVNQIERFLKTAIVDKNSFVSGSAILAGITLMKVAPEVVRRWVNEIQEATGSKHPMVQFHALALLYELKKTDRLGLHKVVIQLAKSQMKSPMAECLLVRYATQALMSDRDPAIEKPLMAYLDSCLRNRSEMVTYEAARSFCQLAAVDTSGQGTSVFGFDAVHAITVLQIFLTSPKPVVRFAAIRTLNQLAQHRPLVVSRCNADMEPLLTDSNRNIATLALTTLLKTGHESNVERLIKQISSFMNDISDVFKVEVVRAVKGLCLQYPSKQKLLTHFLSVHLREEGSQEFKNDLVEALITISNSIPVAKPTVLGHLCEFIEDCEYAGLCTRVLSFLGHEAPNTAAPANYIRFIYNRLILENSMVRAAAVDALSKIACKCPTLRRDILVLLEASRNDNDDEVRERICLYQQVLKTGDKATADNALEELVSVDTEFSLDALYENLGAHLQSESCGVLFDITNVPTQDVYEKAKAAAAPPVPAKKGAAAAAEQAAAPQSAPKVNEQLMNAVEQIFSGTDIGAVLNSTSAQPLTETEAEYTVSVYKHIFQEYIILEFYCGNTVPGTRLENIAVSLKGYDTTKFREVGSIGIGALDADQCESAYVALQKAPSEDGLGVQTAQFKTVLTYLLKEDGDDLGYDDEFPVEGFAITVGDYVSPRGVPGGQWNAAWEAIGAQGMEAQGKFVLNYKSLEAATEGVRKSLNMTAEEAESGSAKAATMRLSGTFAGGSQVVVKALIGLDPQRGCLMKVAVRAKNEAVCNAVVNVFA
mmetsp:Transcript_23528/g.57393  ORF Transcript_23528/g.57393 Transcript_23528/m.57393 type:complete len:908 (-) Transcript_23528:226-2949(-)